MLREFKQFALKGNMVDLAVGIIIGGAFSNIVNSMVTNLLMPLLGLFTNQLNFTDWFIALDGKHYNTLLEAQNNGVATINYGLFLSGVLNFIIMAFVVFLIVKWINKLRPQAAPTTKKCPKCLSDININATKCPSCTTDL